MGSLSSGESFESEAIQVHYQHIMNLNSLCIWQKQNPCTFLAQVHID